MKEQPEKLSGPIRIQIYIDGYDEPISKTQSEMVNNMNQLYELLKKNNIELSLAVYPWPQQLLNNDLDFKTC